MKELCATLTPEQQETVMASLTVHTYKKGERIYGVGDMPLHLMCVLGGKVKIVREGISERPQIVRILCPESYFGYRASFAGQHYETAAIAIETTTVAFVPLRIVVRLLKESQRTAWFFIRQLSAMLGKADERTLNLTQKHIRGRMAETLVWLKDQYGVADDGVTLAISLPREDLANMSNMTTSNAIRTLSAFAKEKLVALEGRRIKILKEEELRNISRFG